MPKKIASYSLALPTINETKLIPQVSELSNFDIDEEQIADQEFKFLRFKATS